MGREESRRMALAVLLSHGMTYTTWYEYALRSHGSKTVVFDLYLLVPSVPSAYAALISAGQGWARAERPPFSSTQWEDGDDVEVLARAEDGGGFRVVLLSECDWGRPRRRFESGTRADFQDGCPALVDFYSSLARRLIRTDSFDFLAYLSLQLAYLELAAAELSSPAFAAQLPPDVLQYHYDRQSDQLSMRADETIRHERWIIEQVELGLWTFMPQGSADVGGKRRDFALEQRLRDAAGYSPYPDSGEEDDVVGEDG